MVHALKNEDKKLEMLAAAGLIQRCVERCPVDEVYRRGVRCYEVLLDVIEKPEITEKIAAFTKQSEETIKVTALKILNLLLFNRGDNPFLSFGLPDYAEDGQIKKRWKRLLMLYHPDRAFNRKGYEETAKKINQVYREIIELKEKNSYKSKDIEEQQKPVPVKTMLPKTSPLIGHFKYLKYLPTFILVAILCIAILAIVFFILYKI
jgi:hypothetical protein